MADCAAVPYRSLPWTININISCGGGCSLLTAGNHNCRSSSSREKLRQGVETDLDYPPGAECPYPHGVGCSNPGLRRGPTGRGVRRQTLYYYYYYYYHYYYYYIGKLQVVETTPKSERTLVCSVGRPKNAFSTPGSRQNFHTEEKPDVPEFRLGCLISRDALRETLF